jgi:hypothetical protein
MRSEECRQWREQIGALVIGGLDESESAALMSHIDSCAECRAEAESLAGTANLLDLVDPARLETPPPTPPDGLGERIGKQIGEEKRKRRRRRGILAGGGVALAAAAAAAVAAIVLPGGSGSSQNDDVENLAFAGLPSGVEIDAALEPRPNGTEIHMTVGGIRSGTLCRVFVRRSTGALVSAGSFRYVYDTDEAPTELTTAVDLADLRAVIVRAGSSRFVQPLSSARD